MLQPLPNPAPIIATKAVRRLIIEHAVIWTTHSVLIPNAGTGSLADTIKFVDGRYPAMLCMVEADYEHAMLLKATPPTGVSMWKVFHREFLKVEPESESMGQFDRVIMIPPLPDDMEQIMHAFRFLRPGGRLVSICANGPRQHAALKPWIEALNGEWYDLPPGSFTASGTNVNTALVAVDLTPGFTIPKAA